MPRVASMDATQHPRFGAVPLCPFMPVGSSDNGLSVAVAAYQAGGRPLISAGSCAEGTCRPLLCPSQARAGRAFLPLAPKKQGARPSRPASSLSLGKSRDFAPCRLASQGACTCEPANRASPGRPDRNTCLRPRSKGPQTCWVGLEERSSQAGALIGPHALVTPISLRHSRPP